MREATLNGVSALDAVRPGKPRPSGGKGRPAPEAGSILAIVRRMRSRAPVVIASAGLCAIMAGIVCNAMLFQRGRHPSPLFGSAQPSEPPQLAGNPVTPPSPAATALPPTPLPIVQQSDEGGQATAAPPARPASPRAAHAAAVPPRHPAAHPTKVASDDIAHLLAGADKPQHRPAAAIAKGGRAAKVVARTAADVAVKPAPVVPRRTLAASGSAGHVPAAAGAAVN